MATNSIRDLLNAAKWRDGNLDDLILTVIHRGGGQSQRHISGARVTAIAAGGVSIGVVSSTSSPDSAPPSGASAFIPFHRFVRITDAAGTTLWAAGEAALGATPAASSTPASDDGWVDVPSDLQVRLRDTSGMLTIDGGAGEGGGQILRSSLALSLLSGRPFVLENIRAGRRKPGLMRQHLTCVRAAAAISGAQVEGATLRSSHLVFRPGSVRGGEHRFDIGSAGSVALVLQTVALPLSLCGEASTMIITGGTHARWAPIVPFLDGAWLPLLRRMGVEAALELEATGFYPAGGGRVRLTLAPVDALSSLYLTATPDNAVLSAHAIVANLPESIARRELLAANKRLCGRLDGSLTAASVPSPGPGNACWILARGGETINVFSALGDHGISAEAVGDEAAKALLAWEQSGAAVCEHLTDQLLLPLSIAGGGRFTCPAPTPHTWTNAAVIAAFERATVTVQQRGLCYRIGVS